MSVLGNTTNRIIPKGMDRRLKGDLGGADIIRNARYDSESGWRFDRGIEPWWKPTSSSAFGSSYLWRLNHTIDAIFVWAKQNTEQTFFFVEQFGTLGYFVGNKNGGSFHNDFVELATGRHIPSANEPGTQFIPFGNKLLILNGYDEPLLFSGDSITRPFSFTLPTPSVEVIDTSPEYWDTGETTSGAMSPQYALTNTYGIGTDGRSSYSWYMTFITDTGSESPISSPFATDWLPDGTAQEGKYGVILSDVPQGPVGTVARRLYRSKNTLTGTAVEATPYFLKQINENASTFFIDVIPDSALSEKVTTTSTVISSAWQLGCAWNNRIWLAGGSVNPTKLIYSEAGKGEEFGGFSFFELGSITGGAITALVPYYNNLIVFRQRSIDIIRYGQSGFTVSQLTPELGTEATNTIRLVPSIGLVFLAQDGIHALQGGMDGGSAISINKISIPVDRELKRLNKACMARATAVYSFKEKEYWLHYPVDGDSFNTRGLVLHQDTGFWSVRYHEDKALSSFSCLAVDTQGNILIGIKPTWDGSVIEQGSTSSLPSLIHVWSGAPYWGVSMTYLANNQGQYTYTIEENALPTYIYETNWMHLTNTTAKNRVISVEVELMSYGNTNISLGYVVDGGYSLVDASEQLMIRPENIGSDKEEACFGSGANALLPTSVVEDGKVIRLRWDVSTGLIESFKYKLTTATPFILLAYYMNVTNQEQKALNQRAGR